MFMSSVSVTMMLTLSVLQVVVNDNLPITSDEIPVLGRFCYYCCWWCWSIAVPGTFIWGLYSVVTC